MKQEKEAFGIVPLYTRMLALIFPFMETLSWKIPVIQLVINFASPFFLHVIGEVWFPLYETVDLDIWLKTFPPPNFVIVQ